jgi:RNA polymerase II transcription factor SIII (Elongin) subunit A
MQMAISTIQRNIIHLDDLGDTPIHIALRIIKYVQRPKQLALIEERTPELAQHTHHFWFNFIKRDVFRWQDMLLKKQKKNGEFWTEDEVKQKTTYKTYKRCIEKSESASREAEEIFQQQMQATKDAAENNETRIVERLPASWMKRRNAGRQESSSTGELRLTKGSKTRTDTGRNMITKFRREAADMRLTRPGSSLSTPSHLLNRAIPPPKIFARREPTMRRLLSARPISQGKSDSPKAASRDPSTTLRNMSKKIAPPRISAKAVPSQSKISSKERGEPKTNDLEEGSKDRNKTQPSPLRPIKRRAEQTVLLPNKRSK